MRQLSLIVGGHFRPPAKQVLARLPAGTLLMLEEDNNNLYDAAAVKVLVDPAVIPESQFGELEPELNEAGVTLEQLMSGGPLQLGFIPAQEGKPLAKARMAEPELLGNMQVRELMPCKASISFAVDGSPRVILEETEQ